MKVLWFTNTSSLYDFGKHPYHGGGWIESLEQIISGDSTLELAVSFFHNKDSEKVKIDESIYYPILRKRDRMNPFKAIIKNYTGNLNSEDKYLPRFLEVIEDFEPDVIHIFGTEGVFQSIQYLTNTPCFVHLQGLMNPTLNAYFPPNTSNLNFILGKGFFLKNLIGQSPFFGKLFFENQAKREENNLKTVRYVMGRTNWDFNFSRLYAPNARYFKINEVLREVFYADAFLHNGSSKLVIVSTISNSIYKGIDLILKTAKMLKTKINLDFEWNLVGLNSNDSLLNYFERKTGIKHNEVGINCLGRKNMFELKSILLSSGIYVHPSYIDNSPNSLCEAQILGVPIIACDVGGISSLVKHKINGILVPSNGVIELTSSILNYVENKNDFLAMAEKGKIEARLRHDRSQIKNDLIKAYSDIIKDQE